jgi:hypothetical protein
MPEKFLFIFVLGVVSEKVRAEGSGCHISQDLPR